MHKYIISNTYLPAWCAEAPDKKLKINKLTIFQMLDGAHIYGCGDSDVGSRASLVPKCSLGMRPWEDGVESR